MRPEDYIISRLHLYKGRYCLFVGAGVSVCAGVPLATADLQGLPSIVSYIRRDFYGSLGMPNLNDDDLLKWYADRKLLQNLETLYSDALHLIGDTPRSRQYYLRKFFEGKKPGVSHIAIAKLIEYDHFHIVFTTNFDPLIEEAVRNNGKCLSPKVAAHEDTVADVLMTEPGPKVIKLHGDYLFSDIKNTEDETSTINSNMRDKLRHVLNEKGLLVIGYSGSDNSIMSIFEQMVYDRGFFPFGLYWFHRVGSPPSDRVVSFVKHAGGQLHAIESADSFLNELADRLGRSNS